MDSGLALVVTEADETAAAAASAHWAARLLLGVLQSSQLTLPAMAAFCQH